MDDSGYLMGGAAFLLMIPLVIIAMMMLGLDEHMASCTAEAAASSSVKRAAEDLKDNIPIITREVLNESAYRVINGDECPDIRENIQERLDRICSGYLNLNASCTVNSVESSSNDPFQVEVNATIRITEGNTGHLENVSERVSVEGLPDPLPFRVLGKLQHNSTTVDYGDKLSNHLNSCGVRGDLYINATGPFIIRRCPYEPYDCHGHDGVLINCLLNGYYHESHDGACYLCRLQGRASCPHPGLETFIIPGVCASSGPVSADHVLFTEPYEGDPVNCSGFILYLDGGHKLKYGLIP